MRLAPALVLLTLAASTASVAAPMGLPTHATDGVAPRVVRIALGPADLLGTRPVGDLLTTARSVAEFSMVGLTWSIPVAGGVFGGDLPLELRTRTHGTWTGWQRLERDDDGPDAGPEDHRAQAATAPLWVGPSDAFQLRLHRSAGVPVAQEEDSLADARGGPTNLAIALIDPGNSPHDSAPMQPARVDRSVRADQLPPIGSRADWGADEKLRHRGPRYTGGIKVAFVHHTAGGNDYAPSDVPKIIRGVYAFHTRARGWSDVGYNFLVDRFGRLWEGRAGGIDRAVLGAHTGGFNSDSFGVAALGNFVHDAPNPAMLAAIERVIAWKFSRYGVSPGLDPSSDTTLVSAGGGTDRWARGRDVTFTRVSGHRDAGSTECPGTLLYAELGEIRSRVRELQANGSGGGTEFRSPLGVLDGGVQTGRTVLQQILQPPKRTDPSVRRDWAAREQALTSAGR